VPRKGFSVESNAVAFRKRVKIIRSNVETEVELEIPRIAKDVRSTLFANTPIATSFTAIKVKGGGKFQRSRKGSGTGSTSARTDFGRVDRLK